MPPWVAFVPRSTSLLKRRGIERLPLALQHCHAAIPRPSQLLHARIRSISAQLSPTAVNARPNIPPRNVELHNALSELGSSAETFVNATRLQLALKGLETQDAIVRVAVLSLGGQKTAQQLARLLLADPLDSERQWEGDLGEMDNEGRPVLLRYGDDSDVHPPSPLYETLSIPSRVLQVHNLEVLISTLNTRVPAAGVIPSLESPTDAIFVPILSEASDQASAAPFPVHKTMVVGEGLHSAVDYGRFAFNTPDSIVGMVKVAVDLPLPLKEPEPDTQSICSAVNVESGTTALATFRESIANSAAYEHEWYRSGMPALSEWLVQGLKPSDSLKSAIKDLVGSIVDDVEVSITKADTAQLNQLAASAIHPDVVQSILGHLESWAEKSHTELRDELDEAFAAPNWHKLAWWKLLWRSDDVSMITSEILERRWLVKAEKSSIYLAGRMEQAGFPDDVRKLSVPAQEKASDASQDQTPSTAPQETVEKEKIALYVSTAVRTPHPWPAQIAASRAELLGVSVPYLQSLSQRLVLAALSTTSISSAVSALLYISLPTFSLFETGAVAALGLTLSLRRLQKVWEEARKTWQAEIREEGRRTLKVTEETVRLIVERSQKPELEAEGVALRKRARDAVGKVRDALAKV